MTVIITRAVQTSMACPAQWDAWDADGNYYYLRFRHGYGTVTQYENEDWVGADPQQEHRHVADFEHGSDQDLGAITLPEFAGRAGLQLAPGLAETGFGDHLRDELVIRGLSYAVADQVTQPWRDLQE